MKKRLYQIEVLTRYIVVAEDEEQAVETYEEQGGDLDDEEITGVYYLDECEE